MRWMISFLVFVAGMAGAVYVYVWNGHVAVPTAIAAITLVFCCMALTVGGDSDESNQPAKRRFNRQPEERWPKRDSPDSRPDGRR